MGLLRVLPALLIVLAVHAQDERPKPPNQETVEIEIKVGKSTQDVYNLPGLKVKDAMNLDGKLTDGRVSRAAQKADDLHSVLQAQA